MTHLEAVRAAIIKAVPEIVELRFGCRVLLKCKALIAYTTEGRVCGVNDWSDGGEFDHHREANERKTIQAGWYRGDGYVITDFTPDKYEILGRPIRLTDVLMAVGSGIRLEEQTSSGQLSIGLAGRGWTIWNLRTDDLSQQSEECINFLHGLLV